MQSSPFSTSTRDSAPLLTHLQSTLRGLNDQLKKLSSVADIDAFDRSEMLAKLQSVAGTAPVLGGMRPASVREPEWRVHPKTSRRVRTVQHYVAIEVTGDPYMLEFWPETDERLRPADSPEWPLSRLVFDDPSSHWILSPFGDSEIPDGPWGLYTFAELTPEEEACVARNELDLQSLFLERRRRIEPIAEAIQAAVKHFYEVEAPRHLNDYLAEKRQEFANREAVTQSLTFPDAWVLPAPALATVAPTSPQNLDECPPELTVPVTPRLSPVSFAGLQRTIRTWADAMERYPVAFGSLSEDRISDLLAATLNATLPGAHREVYSRSGKSDLFITADILSEGAGPAKIFIAESKWATGDKIVREAVDPQLFGYLTASDTSAVLLLLLPQKHRHAAEQRYFKVLHELESFVEEDVSRVEGWPVLVYRHEGRLVRLAVATIHLPR